MPTAVLAQPPTPSEPTGPSPRPSSPATTAEERTNSRLADLNDCGFEELPFKRFPANAAFYYGMLIAFFLAETFKEDVLIEVLPVTSDATTVRRTVIDIAAKVIRTGGQVILKVTQSVMTTLRFARLWTRCHAPPPIAPA